MTPEDHLVMQYQLTGQCEKLIETYKNFIMKYQRMLTTGQIDFTNYDIRRFLACFIPEKEIVRNLCRGKFHSREAIFKAQEVLRNIRAVFDNYENQEIYNELVILFLECAKDYEDIGKDFSSFVYHVFRYRLKKLIDNKMFDGLDGKTGEYKDIYYCEDDRPLDNIIDSRHYYDPLNLEIDEDTDLNNPLWLNGVACSDLFKEMSYSERYILVKAYEEGKDDKEIAKLNGFHHRSIYRIRKRIVDNLREKRLRGEIKCLR